MELEISRPDPHVPAVVTLHEPTDVGRLLVRLKDVDVGDATEALEAVDLGCVDGNHAWLRITGLREAVLAGLTACGAQPDLTPFRSMIDYASRKGWLSADGRSVRAHVEVDPRT